MKLSRANLEAVDDMEQAAKSSLAYAARITCKDTRMPDYITIRPADFYEGQALGFYMAIEVLLFANKAYEGYILDSSDVTSITKENPNGIRAEITTRKYIIKATKKALCYR
tara:strand:- start:432 stop:764 length:333 start_codon:yes stop_codon:yes gene_type:complete